MYNHNKLINSKTRTFVESEEMDLEITGGREGFVTEWTLDGFEPFVNRAHVEREVPSCHERLVTFKDQVTICQHN